MSTCTRTCLSQSGASCSFTISVAVVALCRAAHAKRAAAMHRRASLALHREPHGIMVCCRACGAATVGTVGLAAWASRARGRARRERDAADDNAPYHGLALYPPMPSDCCRVSAGATGAELGLAASGPRCPRTRTNCSRCGSFFATPLSLRCPGHRCALVSHAGASRSSLTQVASCSRGGGPSLLPGVARRACGAGAVLGEQLGPKAPECNHAPRPGLGPDCGAGGAVCE